MSLVATAVAEQTTTPVSRWPFIDSGAELFQGAAALWAKRDYVGAHEHHPEAFPDCKNCPYATDGKPPHQPVTGEGPVDPTWIAIGEGPGGTEIAEQRPFCGPSGRLLQRVLDAASVDRQRIWITNSTLCVSRNKTDADLKAARIACAPRLRGELARFKDVPILALGAVASQGLLGDKFSITEMAGTLQEADVDGSGSLRPIIATHHPARILRGGDGNKITDRGVDLLFWNLIYDTAKVHALGSGQDIRFRYDIEIEYEDADRALVLLERVVADARARGHCAIDTETTGLDSRRCGLTAIAVATTGFAVSIAYPMFSPSTVAGRTLWARFRELCHDEAITKVFQNRIYDEVVLLSHGITLRGPVDDTLLKHHSAFPGASHQLQHIAAQFFAIRPWKSEFRLGTDDDGKQLDVKDLLFYNGCDALVTARLDPILDDCMAKTDGRRCYKVDNACTLVAQQMQIAGIPIDWGVNRKLHTHFQEIIVRTRGLVEDRARDPLLRDKWLDQLAMIAARKPRKGDPPDFLSRHAVRLAQFTYGQKKKRKPDEYVKGKTPAMFKIGTPDHIAAYLQARGHRLSKVTAGGKLSTKKDILEEWTHLEDVRLILEFREAAKMDSTFVNGLVIENGRLHSRWNVHRITGRWSSEPATQNWPKQNMRGRPNLRSQVVAPPGRKLVGADAAQLEARVIGMLSGDPFLCGTFNGARTCADCLALPRGKSCPVHDIHTVFACEVFPSFLSMGKDEKKELRDLVKRGEYGAFYGGSVDTLYRSIVREFPDVTMSDVAKIVMVISQRMPYVGAWHQRLIKQAMQMGEVRSAILGRRRAFPLGNADISVVLNFPVQATGADIIDEGVLRVQAKLAPSDDLIFQGHDSVLIECDEDRAADLAVTVTECMSAEYTVEGVTMFFPTEASVGDSWAEF